MKSIGMFLGVAPGIGGMAQYAKALLEALITDSREKRQISVAYYHDEWLPVLHKYQVNAIKLSQGELGVKMADAMMVARLPRRLTRFLASCFNPVVHQLDKAGCDLWIFPAQDSLSYQIKGEVLSTVHDLMHRYEPHFPEVSSNGRYKIREHRFKNMVLSSSGILVDSEVGKKQVMDSYAAEPEKIYVLPYIPPPHSLQNNESADFDKKYNLPEKFLFYPAQYWSHKNHKRLVSAAAKLKEKCPDIKLLFTGQKKYSWKDLLAHTQQENMTEHVIFMDHHIPDEDFVGFFKRARAMVMPTFFGPTNIPPLEAMANSCPVAVSRIYAMPEQLGNAALYFDPKSEDEMSEVLFNLWTDDDLCQELVLKGKTKVASWGQSQFAERFSQILQAMGE